MTLIGWALDFCFASLALALLLGLWRLLRGPDDADRVLALDTLVVNGVALIIVLALKLGSDLLFDAALVVAMLGFVATVALARQLVRGDVIE